MDLSWLYGIPLTAHSMNSEHSRPRGPMERARGSFLFGGFYGIVRLWFGFRFRQGFDEGFRARLDEIAFLLFIRFVLAGIHVLDGVGAGGSIGGGLFLGNLRSLICLSAFDHG